MDTSYYVIYAGILVEIATKFGFTIAPAEAQTVVSALFVVVGIIWSHYNKNQLVAQARLAGVHV